MLPKSSICCLILRGRSLLAPSLLFVFLSSGCGGQESQQPMSETDRGAATAPAAAPVNRIATLAPATTTDWPQIRGQGGAATVMEGTVAVWGNAGPENLWSRKIGAGFSSPVIFSNNLFIVHRADGGTSRTTAELLSADTGEPIWRQELLCSYGNGAMDGDPGPKATPVYSGGKLFFYDPAGMMFCLDAVSGETIWQTDLAKKYGSNQGYFGMGASPIVCGQNVVVNVGGRAAAVVALATDTGAEAWKVFDDRASYSSPVQTMIGDKLALIVVTRLHVIGIEARSGKLAFKTRFGKTGPTAVAAMPVLIDDHVFVNAAYNVGGKTMALAGGEPSLGRDGYQPEVLWSDPDVFASQYSTPVLHQGLLYGTSGREDFGNGSFRCFDPLTGALKWQQQNIAVGHSLLVGERIVFLDHSGNLRLIEASPTGYKQLAECRLYASPTKTIPAISNGRLYTRCDGRNATLDCWRLTDFHKN